MIDRFPFFQLVLCHLRGYLREPEAIFWTYGFPLIMVIALGLAFRSSAQEVVTLDVVEGVASERLKASLGEKEGFDITVRSRDEALQRLRRNKVPIVVEGSPEDGYLYHYDPTNPEGRSARAALDEALQREAGRQDVLKVTNVEVRAPGSRYIDFLVPGLIGMNLMGGGLWGIGFSLVDMRLKKLLKRLLGTPMGRRQFLLSVISTRIIFFVPEAFILLIGAHLIFGVPIAGNILTIVLIAFVGAMTFAGMGLLAASRAERIESISGILNVVMLPMWICSGVFFSSERFPEFMQPFVQALPLTQLNNALRAVVLEGQPLLSQALPLAILLAWMGVSFLLAVRWFRWS